MGWWTFATQEFPCYIEIVHEFLSSLWDKQNGKYGFRLLNKGYELTIKTISDALKLPNSGAPRLPQLDIDVEWAVISGGDVDYHNKSKASEIKSPTMRLLHRWITHTINGRGTSHDAVTVEDLKLLACFRQNIQLHGARWLIHKWLNQTTKQNGKLCGSYITAVVLHRVSTLDPHLFTLVPYVSATDDVNVLSLKSMGVIKQYRIGNRRGQKVWLKSPEDGSVPEGHVPIDPIPHAAPVYSASRRRRFHEVGSSSAPPEPAPEPTAPPLPDMSYFMLQIQNQLSALRTDLQASIQSVQTHFDERYDQLTTEVFRISRHLMPPSIPTDVAQPSETAPSTAMTIDPPQPIDDMFDIDDLH